jgi:hypothetical protein
MLELQLGLIPLLTPMLMPMPKLELLTMLVLAIVLIHQSMLRLELTFQLMVAPQLVPELDQLLMLVLLSIEHPTLELLINLLLVQQLVPLHQQSKAFDSFEVAILESNPK